MSRGRSVSGRCHRAKCVDCRMRGRRHDCHGRAGASPGSFAILPETLTGGSPSPRVRASPGTLYNPGMSPRKHERRKRRSLPAWVHWPKLIHQKK